MNEIRQDEGRETTLEYACHKLAYTQYVIIVLKLDVIGFKSS